MNDPTTEQLIALDDAVDAVYDAGWTRDEIDEHVAAHLDDLGSDERNDV